MPTDHVQNRKFKSLFQDSVRFRIPFFQRGYAWERKQWDQLFQDIEEQILPDVQAGNPLTDIEHFFGPVVVMEEPGHPSIKEFLVIDGQQRLTTIYLLLGKIYSHLASKKSLSPDAATYMHALEPVLRNGVESNDDYDKLKLFSSKGDRLPTYRAIFGLGTNPKSPLATADLHSFVSGSSNVEAFEKYLDRKLRADYRDVPSLWLLSQVLLQCLTVVWIPLSQGKDDSQAIFESLNDKGLQLTASELLCSFLFRPIIEAKEDPEVIHEEYWLSSIRILGGNPEFENYLRNLFSIGESKMVGRQRRTYVHVKSKHKSLTLGSAKLQLKEIAASAPLYRTVLEPLGHPHVHQGVNRMLLAIRQTRMDSSTVFLLALLRANQNGLLNHDQTALLLQDTLTLLVRRKMTELSTTQYDTMFPQLLQKVLDEPNRSKALHDQFKKFGVWISDQEFAQALLNKSLYRSKDLPFSRMVLTEIDRKMETHGQLPDYSTVNSIEHILPQQLDAEWRAYLGEGAQNEALPTALHTLGNLCLLSGQANSSAGQDPFHKKLAGYSSVTALNRELKQEKGPWNLAAIRNRSERLGKLALEIWSWQAE